MLIGRKATLRAPGDADLELLFSLRNDVQLQQQLLAVPRPNTLQRVHDWLQRRLSDEQSVFFVVADRESGRGCGFLQIVHIDLLHQTGELGICLAPTERGKGYGREAITLAQRYVRSTFGMRKLTLQVLASNQSAIRLYQRLDYTVVGTLQRHFYFGGEYHDVVIMEHFLQPEEVN